MKRILTSCFALVGAALLSVAALAADLNKPAPDFTLKAMDGSNVKLSELKGKVVMLNFWASWCGPCRQEMPYLEDIYKKYAPAGFVLLGINVDEDSADAKEFLADVPVSFPVLLDSKNTLPELYEVEAMPSTFFVDKDGNLVYLHKGYKPGEEKEYEAQIQKLL